MVKHSISALLLFVAVSANGALIDNGHFTSDTATRLDWLDLTATQGASPGQVYQLLNSMPSLGSGWRFANDEETVDLVTRNTGAQIGVGYSAGSPQAIAADGLMALLGITYTNPSQFYLNYFAAGWFVTGPNSLAILEIENDRNTYGLTRYDRGYTFSSPSGSGVGSFMVRATVVPIPAGAMLLASALGVLGFARRR